MLDFRSNFSVFVFYVVIGSTIGAVVQPRSKSESFISDGETSGAEKASRISQPTKSILSNSIKIIVNLTSLNNESRQIECNCVVFNDCSDDDFVMLPPDSSDEDICSRPDVCCKSGIPTWPEEIEPPLSDIIKFIIYGVSDDVERRKLECECMAEFLCLDEDVIDLPTTYSNGVCQTPDVCCKIETTTSSINEIQETSMISQPTEAPISPMVSQKTEALATPMISKSSEPLVSTTISQPTEAISFSHTKEIIYGLSEDGEHRELICECVLFFECPDENLIPTPTAYSNGDQCPSPTACCKKSTSTLPATEPTSSNDTKFIIYGLSDDDERRELQCECVLFFECSDEDSIPLPTAYSKGNQCAPPDVCCKWSNSTPTEQTLYYNNPKITGYGLSEVISQTTERMSSNAGDVFSTGMWGYLENQGLFRKFVIFSTYAYCLLYCNTVAFFGN